MTTASAVELIPRRVLFGNPVKTGPRISPDGERMAYIAPVNDVLNVWVGAAGSEDYQPVTQDTERGVRFYFWTADNKHIMYIQDIKGNENWRLYATSIGTRATRDLTPFEDVQARIIDHDKHFPNELLIGLNKENPQVHDVYHLDLTTGELTLVAKNPGNVAGWVTDTQFKVRGAVAPRPDGGQDLLIRDTEQSEWRTLLTWDADDALTSGPVGFTKDGQSLYLIDSRNVNAGRLVKLNIATGDATVIAQDSQYDVGNVMVNPDTYEVQAVAFIKDRVEWAVLDESIRLDFDRMRGIHRGDFFITSRDDADTTWIVAFTVDNGPVPFYVYDRKNQSATFLFNNQPELNKYTLAQMTPITFYGGSYGGYAALVGATFTPDLFCCAVDIVGPSNLTTLIKTIPPYWAPLLATFHERVGNPDTEEEFLKSRSPLFKVDQIKIPILIAQGANDPRVKQAESEQIVEAMKGRAIEYEYMLFSDEGHGFAKPENRLTFYAVAEKFLARYLGGRYEKE